MKFLKIKASLLMLVTLFLFSGCSQYEQAMVANALANNQSRPNYNNGYSNSYQPNNNYYYREGKTDGCKSRKQGRTIKDRYKWRNYRGYRNGWSNGYNTCRRNSDHQANYYNRGYNDGCWSKRNRGTRKNYRLYRSNYTYKNGWQSGYRSCRKNYYR